MVELIPYADLTWPEVARLPRALPLLIPLGRDEYDYAAVAQQMAAEHVAVLPPVPYGFRRADGDPSGQLSVRPGLLGRVLRGIQRELKAQAFERVIFLNGHGDQGLRAAGLEVLDCAYRQRLGLDIPSDLHSHVTVISAGHTEQHGHHLPL